MLFVYVLPAALKAQVGSVQTIATDVTTVKYNALLSNVNGLITQVTRGANRSKCLGMRQSNGVTLQMPYACRCY